MAVKGNPKVLDALGELLALELAAINQYFIHARLIENWGYTKLGQKVYQEALGEMKHADVLIKRIIFLEGIPDISRTNPIRIGKNVKEQFQSDLALEYQGVAAYNERIRLCVSESDGGSRELLEQILKDTEGHVDWLEAQLHMIDEMGFENYLSQQI